MIVCHCQSISDRDIQAAIDWMRAADPLTLITPGKVYRALGKTSECGGCLPLFLATMQNNANMEVPVPLRGRGMRQGPIQDEGHEGRRKGHRLP